MDVGILAPAVIGQLLLRQVGQQLIGEFRLRLGLDHGNGIPVEIAHVFPAPGAQVAAAQQLKNAVTDMGQAQIGNGIDLIFIQIQSKIVFHSFSPRLIRNWAHRPVNRPVTTLTGISTGRYTST